MSAQHDIKEVQHNGAILSADDSAYRISSFHGSLSVEYVCGRQDEIPLFSNEAPLIFKLRNKWQGNGHKMSGITQGYFIVFAPREWVRTGDAAIDEPEGCTDTEFLAHYFHRDKGSAKNEIGGFKDCGDVLSQAKFALRGECLVDDSEDGELFIGDPPRLKPADGIIWARVGEEKPEGWGENFKPADRSLGDVLGDRQGRFYIRVYNEEAKLADSCEFRYCSDLKEIQINGEPYSRDSLLIPPSSGYLATTLQFIGDDGACLHPKTNSVHATVEVEGSVTIAPCQEGDEIVCTLPAKTASVDVLIKLPRIWWRFEYRENCSETWCDIPWVMTREEFCILAGEQAKVKFCLPWHIKTVRAGFDNDLNRTFPVSDGLPLGDFIDYAEIDTPSEKDVKFRIQCGESVLTLIHVSADSIPPPDLASMSNTTEPTSYRKFLYHRVKKGKGYTFRHGKGFSRNELLTVGLHNDAEIDLDVRIDRRRRSTHRINISTLDKAKDDA